VDGDVYFSVESDPKYGELSHQRLEDLNAGARGEANDLKKNPQDFALWKKTDKGIKWDSPWGPGRPGWHTECVVMIGKEFNSGMIDIHGGGRDLKFPHHENEVAQSECCNGHHLANYWIHNGMLETKGGKMSKSLGNTQWAKDVIAEHGANLVRWFLLSAKYRDSLIYDDETFTAAKTELNKIETALKHGVRPRCEVLKPEEVQYYIDLGVKDFSMGDEYKKLLELWNGDGEKLRAIADGLGK